MEKGLTNGVTGRRLLANLRIIRKNWGGSSLRKGKLFNSSDLCRYFSTFSHKNKNSFT